MMKQLAPALHGQLPGSLELAYLGDTIYDLYVRRTLVETGGKTNALHAQATKKVNAAAQSQALAYIETRLTQNESDVVRRARNAKQTPPRNADAQAYHRATAMEALIGYLALTGQYERLNEIMSIALNARLDEER